MKFQQGVQVEKIKESMCLIYGVSLRFLGCLSGLRPPQTSDFSSHALHALSSSKRCEVLWTTPWGFTKTIRAGTPVEVFAPPLATHTRRQ